MVKSAGHRRSEDHRWSDPTLSVRRGCRESSNTSDHNFANFPPQDAPQSLDAIHARLAEQATCFLGVKPTPSLVGPVAESGRGVHVRPREVYAYSKTASLSDARGQWQRDLHSDTDFPELVATYREAFFQRDFVGVASALQGLFDRAAVIAGVEVRQNRYVDVQRMVRAQDHVKIDPSGSLSCDDQSIRAGGQESLKLLRQEQEAAVTWIEGVVRQATLDAQNAPERAVAFTGYEYSLFAESLVNAGERTLARKYYRVAAEDAPTQVDALFFRLRAHQQMSPDERRVALEELGSEIAQLRVDLMMGHVDDRSAATQRLQDAEGEAHVLSHELAEIRTAVPVLLREALRVEKNGADAPWEPEYVYVPPHLEGTDPETWKSYPTVVVQTRNGQPTGTPPLYLNIDEATQMAVAPMQNPEQHVWSRMLRYAMAQAGGDLPSVPAQVFSQDPIVVHQPIDGMETLQQRPGSVAQVRALYHEAWKQEYLEGIKDVERNFVLAEDEGDAADSLAAAHQRLEQLEVELRDLLTAYLEKNEFEPGHRLAESDAICTDIATSQEPLSEADRLQILGSALMVARRWTALGGVVDQVQMTEGIESAEAKFRTGVLAQIDAQLGQIFDQDSLQVRRADDPILSAHVRFRWAVDYDGGLAIGRADHALDNIRTLFDTFTSSSEVQKLQQRLERNAPWLFTSVDGETRLRSHVDLTAKNAYEHLIQQSREAAEREATRYYFHNDELMNQGMPLGGAFLGGVAGTALGMLVCAETLPLCVTGFAVTGGGLGGGGGSYLNRQYSLNQNAARVQAAAQTGLTRVTAQASALVQSRWSMQLGITTLLTSPFGLAGRGVYGPLRNIAVAGMQRATWANMFSVGRAGVAAAAHSVANAGRAAMATPAAEWFSVALHGGRTLAAGVTQAGGQAIARLRAAGAGVAGDLSAKFINAESRWPAVRVLSGLLFMGADYFGINENYELETDLELNTTIGWLGAALLYNETVSQYILGVNVTGQLVSLGISGLAEIGMQAMQHRELSRPDGERIFWLNAFGTVSSFISKSWVYGSEYFQRFAFGREILAPIHQAIRSRTQLFHAVTSRPKTVKYWVSPKTQANGKQFLAVNPPLAGQWRVVPTKSGPKFTVSQGSTIAADDFFTLHPQLNANAWSVPSRANHFRFSLRRPLTEAEYRALAYRSPRRWESVTLANGKTGYQLKARPQTGRQDISAKNWLKAVGKEKQWKWQKGSAGAVGGFVPSRTMSFAEYTAINPLATNGWRPLKTPVAGSGGRPQRLFEWETPRLSPAEHQRLLPFVTGKDALGSFSPRLTFKGAWVNAWGSLSVIGGLNYFVGSEAQEADKYYHTLHRTVDYGIAIFITWPLIQIPLGIDTPKAQAAGRSFGLVWRFLGTYIFPTYSEPWIGREKYQHKLQDGNVEAAYDVLFDTAQSLTNPYFAVVDREPGDVDGTWWRLETRAFRTIRKHHDALFTAAAAEEALPNRDASLPGAKAQELLAFAQTVEHAFNRVKDGGGHTELYEGRLFLALAAYMKGRVTAYVQPDESDTISEFAIAVGRQPVLPETAKYTPETALPLFTPFIQLMKEHAEFFRDLPAPASDREWSLFIRQLNAGTYDSEFQDL